MATEAHPPSTRPRPRLPTFDAFRYGDYRLFWFAMMASVAGQYLWRNTQSWLLLNLTNDPFVLGLAGFFTQVPVLLLSFVAGAVADRTDKRWVLAVAQVGFAVGALLLGVLVATGVAQVWHVLGLAVLSGLCRAFFYPTRQAIVPDLVARTEVTNGIALNSAGFYLANIASAAALGWLIEKVNIGGSFYTGAAVFGVSLAALSIMSNVRRGPAVLAERRLGAQLLECLRYVRGDRALLVLLLIAAIPAIFQVEVVLVLAPVFARDILHVGAMGLGMLLAAQSAGSLVGSVGLASAGNPTHKGLLVMGSIFVQGLSLALFALSTSYPLSLGLMLLNGVATAVFVSTHIALLQLLAPDHLRGSVMGLYFLTFMGLMPVGSLLSGWLASVASAPMAVALSGSLTVLGAIVLLTAAPRVRRLD